MADTKTSALTAAGSALAADEIAVVHSGRLRKMRLDTLGVFIKPTVNAFLQTQIGPAQNITAGTNYYIEGSSVVIPVSKLRVGTIIRWTITQTKSAVTFSGQSFFTFMGTLQTTGDAVLTTSTKPSNGSAAADTAVIRITSVIRGPTLATATLVTQQYWAHNLAATGFLGVAVTSQNLVSGAFDATAANLVLGLGTVTGGTDQITIVGVTVEVLNLV